MSLYEAGIYMSDYYDDDYDEPDPRRCPHCYAFVSTKPDACRYIQGPDIVEYTYIDCKRCKREVWGYSDTVASVWPRFDWTAEIELMEEYAEYEPPVEWGEAGEFIPADDLPF